MWVLLGTHSCSPSVVTVHTVPHHFYGFRGFVRTLETCTWCHNVCQKPMREGESGEDDLVMSSCYAMNLKLVGKRTQPDPSSSSKCKALMFYHNSCRRSTRRKSYVTYSYTRHFTGVDVGPNTYFSLSLPTLFLSMICEASTETLKTNCKDSLHCLTTNLL